MKTVSDFWDEMVVPDYTASMADPGSLRAAFHCAGSLFHMTDWVWQAHKSAGGGTQSLAYLNSLGSAAHSSSVSTFADALEDSTPSFAYIRAIANAGKHRKLDKNKNGRVKPVDDSDNLAASMTIVEQLGGISSGPLSSGPISGGPLTIERRIKVVSIDGTTLFFDMLSREVFQMWIALRSANSW